MSNIEVSIISLVFNHEKYIRKALDGFLMQKTTFPFEIIIHDDASTDNTAKIIKEYEEKYPDIIHAIYEDENQYSKGKLRECSKKMAEMSKGKYVALCEGDDYWVDPYKLQKQYEALENNPDCKMCIGKVEMIDEEDTQIVGILPNEQYKGKTGVLTSRDFLSACIKQTFQTSTYFFDAELYRNFRGNRPKFVEMCSVGDAVMLLYFANQGNVYYIDEFLSHYRTMSLSSWSLEMQKDVNKLVSHYKNMCETLKEFENFSEGKYNDIMEIRILRYEFQILKITGNYREMCKKKYNSVRKEYSFLGNTKMKLGCIFPNLVAKFDKWVIKNGR